jgi:hypothetical protein
MRACTLRDAVGEITFWQRCQPRLAGILFRLAKKLRLSAVHDSLAKD